MAKDFVRSKDNVKNITTEKIDHTEDTDLQNQITNIKTNISNISKMIETLKFMSSGQPPYKEVNDLLHDGE